VWSFCASASAARAIERACSAGSSLQALSTARPRVAAIVDPKHVRREQHRVCASRRGGRVIGLGVEQVGERVRIARHELACLAPCERR